MERRIKERLTGAAILVMLGVIFIPMILDDSVHTDTTIEETNIPDRPDTRFDSPPTPREQTQPVPEPRTEARSDPEPEPPQAEPESEPAPEPSKAAPRSETKPDAGGDTAQESSGGEEAATVDSQPEPQEKEQPQPEPAPEEMETQATPAPDPPARKVPSPAEPQSRGLVAWVVQIGSFSREDNANRLVKRLQESGYPAFIEPLAQDSGTVYRVRIGPELLRSDADDLKEKLERELEMEGIVVEYP